MPQYPDSTGGAHTTLVVLLSKGKRRKRRNRRIKKLKNGKKKGKCRGGENL